MHKLRLSFLTMVVGFLPLAPLTAAEPPAAGEPTTIHVHKQSRKLDDAGDYKPTTVEETWQPRETCVIVCGMRTRTIASMRSVEENARAAHE